MSNSRNQMRLGWLAVVLVASACDGDGDVANTETISSAIYQGISITQTELDDSGLVAIYHPKDPSFPSFYPRPCSGVIVSSDGGLTTILTARHCVTTDNSVGGTLVDPSRLRLVRTLNPGPANPNPPAGITPYLVMDKQGPQNDVAVVFASVDWTSIGDKRIGLYVGDPHTLVGTQFTAYGYGINVADGSCGVDNTSSGAGTARSGAAFTVTAGANWAGSGQPASYDHNATSTGGQALYCGDSGGPDELILTGAGRMILGVHSTGSSTINDVSSTPFDFHLQNAVGGLYLTPSSQRNSDVMVGVDSATNVLKMVGRTNPDQVTFAYDVPTKRLWIGAWACASAANGSPAPAARAAECSSTDPTQQWEVRTSGQLFNAASGKCLTAGTSSLALGPCVTRDFFGRITIPATTMWLFHAQP
jgi:hypothetical protein